MATIISDANWLRASAQRTAQARAQKEAEKARALIKQRENLIESLELILGQAALEAILASQETPSEPQHVRSGRFEFRGRNDACGTGFTIICPDYRKGNGYQAQFESLWIDSLHDFDSEIARLSDEMQERDEFLAERQRQVAERQSAPVKIVEKPQSQDQRTALVFCESLRLRLIDAAPLTGQERALVGLINALSGITEMIATQDYSDNQPEDSDDNDNR